MENRKLVINTARCDTRKVSEETLKQYESIVINSAMVLTNARSRVLLDQYNVQMNCASVLDVEEDVDFRTVNGSAEIKSTDDFGGKFYYVVNGSLTIGPGTEKVMERCVGILVNGSVTYPESMSGKLGSLNVNGSSTCYPDGAILLKRNAVIDRTFALRARKGLYWAARRLILTDPRLEPGKLANKGVRFSSKEAIITESLAPELAELIDEKTDLIIVPDGTAVIRDDVELGDDLVAGKGTKLYIIGDLTVCKAAGQALGKLEYLAVHGNVKVAQELRQKLLQAADEITGSIRVAKGRTVSDKMNIRVTRWMLEQEKEGLSVTDCVEVMLDEDIPGELILERLRITDCFNVRCAPEQEGALVMVCEDVVNMGSAKEGGQENAVQELLKSAFNGGLKDTKIVNCAEYAM